MNAGRDRPRRCPGAAGAALVVLAASLAAISPCSRAAETAAPASTPAQPSTPSPAGGGTAEERTEVPLRLFNRTITVFRAPFLGVTPEDRAARTRRTLAEILDKGGPGKVEVRPAPQGNMVMIDGELAIIITPQDTDRLRNQSLEEDTAQAAANLEKVIAETRESRDRSRLLRSAAAASVATAILAFAIWVIWRARGWLVRGLAGLLQRRTAALEVAGARLLKAERVYGVASLLVRGLSWLLVLLFTDRWLSYVFNQFPYTRPWGEGLDDFLLGTVRNIAGGIVKSVPDLVVAVVIFLLARGVVAILGPIFDHIEAGRGRLRWLDADSVRPTRRIVNVAVWLFALVMAYPYLPGSQSEAFKGMSVLIGLVITVGGSSVFGQAASGLILMYSRTLRIGDYVRVNEHEGTVVGMGTFTTRIRTGLGEELTLPNGMVLGTVIRNYSRAVKGPGFIVDTTVTIGYDTPWRQVEAMLVEAAKRTPGILADPAPRVFQTGLTDFYPEYRLVCQAIPAEPMPRAVVLSALHTNIQDVFNEYGVQIMSPHYLGDPDSPKVVPKGKWYAAPAAPPDASRS